MGKNKAGYIIICLLGILVWNLSFGSNRDKRNNVIDTTIYYCGFVKEATGNNDGYWVEKFIASTGLDPKGEYAWCAAMQCYIQIVNGLPVPQYAARAAAWFDDEHTIPNEKARAADLGSLYYRNLGRIGHIVRYLVDFDTPGLYVKTGEGNTNSQNSREGNRAAIRYRLKSTIHSSANWIPLKTDRFYKCNMK